MRLLAEQIECLLRPGWPLPGKVDAARGEPALPGAFRPRALLGFFALLSGEWAADAALTGRADGYASRVRDELVPELSRAARLEASFFTPAFANLMMDALQDSSAIAGVLADLIAGQQNYKGLKWRLIQTREWRLAWRAFVNAGR